MNDSNPMSPGQVAEAFYSAFVRRDLDTLEPFYAEDVQFRDAIFSYHDRAGVMNMWRKLLGGDAKVTLSYEVLGADATSARVRWQAHYRLLKGRPIHNVIETTLTVEAGRIREHVDAFDLRRWARQALPLGPLVHVPGVLSGVKALARRRIG